MAKHHPMQSCKDFLAKPKCKNQGHLAQCYVCGNVFILKIGSIYNPFWSQVTVGKGIDK